MLIDRRFRFQAIKGNYEPWYCGLVDPYTDKVKKAWWECPHCQLHFKTRIACQKHCKGAEGMYPPSCSNLKKGGNCYSGCRHGF